MSSRPRRWIGAKTERQLAESPEGDVVLMPVLVRVVMAVPATLLIALSGVAMTMSMIPIPWFRTAARDFYGFATVVLRMIFTGVPPPSA